MEFNLKDAEQLQAEELVRQVKESAASLLENRAGNEIYQFAWRRAAQLVREMDFKVSLNDHAEVS